MQEFKRNGINILLEHAPKTPRMCVSFFFKTNKKEKYYGINSLLARLLLLGTKKYTSEQLALEFENECIDVSSKAKQDYIKISAVFLNEDFNHTMELISDLIINSTFKELDKEIYKIKGEIASDLDNPRLKLTDGFVKGLFKDHPYSSTLTKILETIDCITLDDIKQAHQNMLNSTSAIVLVGDYENEENILNYFENNFSFMKSSDCPNEISDIFHNNITEDETIWLVKNDASQAQILQGWLIDSFNSELCAKYSVMNNILGSSGLSSRLFVNLRDKQGLAYTVRSQYETLLHAGIFSMYIGTNPINIEKSLKGFEIELKKLANELPSDEELIGAKENISGRIKYFSQNNSQICASKGYDYLMGLGLNYDELFLDDVYNVSKEDVSRMAQKILSLPKLNVIIAPEQYHLK